MHVAIKARTLWAFFPVAFSQIFLKKKNQEDIRQDVQQWGRLDNEQKGISEKLKKLKLIRADLLPPAQT